MAACFTNCTYLESMNDSTSSCLNEHNLCLKCRGKSLPTASWLSSPGKKLTSLGNILNKSST
ncbi:hypothetical protein BpHYR1_026296 [Brachionus plicatilis]|uniref:Uncharacterized protein n=1 Tax=Brachionus plicatilis TaxID=10195 RepID=A0A3M7Q9N9_BRAPC|nr:hypothetical protein BpHYR1_026296 [Brachionus plicatilis]